MISRLKSWLLTSLLFLTSGVSPKADWYAIRIDPPPPPPGQSGSRQTNVWILPVTGLTQPLRESIILSDSGGAAKPAQIFTPVNGSAILTNIHGHAQFQLLSGNAQYNLGANNIEIIDRARLIFTRTGREFLMNFRTKHAKAVALGTELAIEVDDETETTTISLFEGSFTATNLEGASVPFQGEFRNKTNSLEPFTFVIDPKAEIPFRPVEGQVVQWWLYYPTILALEDLPADLFQMPEFFESLTAYRKGDFAAAYASLPPQPNLSAPGAREYVASMLIASGEVKKATNLLAAVGVNPQVSAALRTLVAAISGYTNRFNLSTNTISEELALSWRLQAEGHLADALQITRSLGRQFSTPLVQARLAQLEFASGNLPAARKAVDRVLSQQGAPKMATAVTIDGFLKAAENRFDEAITSFETAIELDGRVGDAWFGRGLVRYRRGEISAGIADILIAARRQRNKALFRAYLARLQLLAGENESGTNELQNALNLDPRSPTPWWFAALENFRTNQFNEAALNLQTSLDLNDNPDRIRSRRMLDRDRAVRLASQATILQATGLPQLAMRDAAYAVASDPASHSAHLFMAESFNALRDPTRFQTRYDSLWLNELLLANLFASVGAGPLAVNISQEEYSRMIDRDGLRASTSFEARSDGQTREVASQSGSYGSFAYALDLDWQHNERRLYAGGLDRSEGYAQVKQQVGLADTFLLLTRWSDFQSGDNLQRYDPATRSANAIFNESQLPIAVGLWRHEWSADNQTLAMVGRLENDQTLSADNSLKRIWLTQAAGPPLSLNRRVNLTYESEFETYIGEVAHIFQTDRNALEVGARGQFGEFSANSDVTLVSGLQNISKVNVNPAFDRAAAYVYDHWRVANELTLIGGVSYDRVLAPANIRNIPLSEGTAIDSGFFPKFGTLWRVNSSVAMRVMYARTLSGVAIDDSFRLEPTQLAGFPQAYRSLIPEADGGPVDGYMLHSCGIAFDFTHNPRTYSGISLRGSIADVARETGAITVTSNNIYSSIQTMERLQYHDVDGEAWAGMLLGSSGYGGLTLGLDHAHLDESLPDFNSQRERDTTLFSAGGRVGMNLSSGWFWQLDSTWYWQKSLGASGVGIWSFDNFEQSNLSIGWRFPQRHGDITAGIYNLGGHDYRLDPLSQQAQFPRERTFFIRLRFDLGPYGRTK